MTAALQFSSSLEWSLLPAGRIGKFSFLSQGPDPDSLHLIFSTSCLTLAYTDSRKPFKQRKILSNKMIRIVL